MDGQVSTTVRVNVPRSVKIRTGTMKIMFFNIYPAMLIEYVAPFAHFGSDILLGGVSELCLCNTAWRLNIGATGVQVRKSGRSSFYLTEIPGMRTEDVQYVCVLRSTEIWNEGYNALLESPYTAERVMKTQFYDEMDVYFSCGIIFDI